MLELFKTILTPTGIAGCIILSTIIGAIFVRRDTAQSSPGIPPDTGIAERDGLVLSLDGDSVSVSTETTDKTWPFASAVPDTPEALMDWSAQQSDDLANNIEQLIKQGLAFNTLVRTDAGGWQRISGRPVGLQLTIEVCPANSLEAELISQIEAQRIKLIEADAMIERGAAHTTAAYEVTSGGDIVWSNRTAREVLDIGRGNRNLRAVPPDPSDGIVTLRSATGRRLGAARVASVTLSNGNKLICVQDAETEMRARESLKTFTATLTETFAHLDVALAIFDASGRLSLFNPAVSELLGIGPSQLALRPGFHEFLDLLRGQQMVPEHRSFTIWRKATIDRLKAVRDEAYQETWNLPEGQTLQVTSRPHPGGGVAIIFKDMSPLAQIEGKYMAELENSQAVLDALTVGLGIVGLSGEVLYANTDFANAWSSSANPVDTETLTLDHILSELGHRVASAATTSMVKEFVMGSRKTGALKIDFASNSQEAMLLSSLPDGSTLMQVGKADELRIVEQPGEDAHLFSADGARPRIVGER